MSNADAIDLIDSDGDGYANFKEYIFGTSPVDKTSAFKLSLRGSNQLNWEPVLSGRSYELQWTDNLMNPFQTIEVFQSTTREYIKRQNSDQSKGFYRIQVKMND